MKKGGNNGEVGEQLTTADLDKSRVRGHGKELRKCKALPRWDYRRIHHVESEKAMLLNKQKMDVLRAQYKILVSS